LLSDITLGGLFLNCLFMQTATVRAALPLLPQHSRGMLRESSQEEDPRPGRVPRPDLFPPRRSVEIPAIIPE